MTTIGQTETFKNQFNNIAEAQQTIRLAFGRILRMGSRASQPGDIDEYDRCKYLIKDANEFIESKNKKS